MFGESFPSSTPESDNAQLPEARGGFERQRRVLLIADSDIESSTKVLQQAAIRFRTRVLRAPMVLDPKNETIVPGEVELHVLDRQPGDADLQDIQIAEELLREKGIAVRRAEAAQSATL